MDETLLDLGEHITGELSGQGESSVLDRSPRRTHRDGGCGTHHKVLRFLRDDPSCQFVCFIDICGVDYPAREKRFDVVYHLLSPYQNTRIRVKVMTDEDTPVPSAVDVFSRPPTGSSAKPSTCMASCSPATRTCAAS
jgi:NADH-quinone oxidoreductase subunit C